MRIILAYKLNEKLMAREGFLGVPSSRLASSSFAVVSKRMKKKKKKLRLPRIRILIRTSSIDRLPSRMNED